MSYDDAIRSPGCLLVFSLNLAAALQLARPFLHGLPPALALLADPAETHEVHAQGVQAALVHERARHDHVVAEVAGQVPVVGLHVGVGPQATEAVAPAGPTVIFTMASLLSMPSFIV